MKYEEAYTEFDKSILDSVKKLVPDSFAGIMKEGGADFTLPNDRDPELKVKYDIREDGESLTLKFSWDNDLGEEDEENED